MIASNNMIKKSPVSCVKGVGNKILHWESGISSMINQNKILISKGNIQFSFTNNGKRLLWKVTFKPLPHPFNNRHLNKKPFNNISVCFFVTINKNITDKCTKSKYIQTNRDKIKYFMLIQIH